MLRAAIVALAIVLVLGSSAFARGGGYGSGGEGFRGSHFGGGFGSTPGNHAGYANRASGLRGEFRGYGSRDVWGHSGAYYGPMIPTI
jgi:hypothetical protein